MFVLPTLMELLETEEACSKFTHLYEKYQLLLYHIARRILLDDGLAEDVVQQTFLQVLQFFDQVGDPDSVRTKNWLCLIARNMALNEKLRQGRQPLPMEELSCCGAPVWTEEEGEASYIRDCIDRLPGIYQDILYLELILGFNHRETAKLLRLKESTVRKRYQRAREQLQEMLTEGGKAHETEAH